MPSLVEQLQASALNPNTRVSDLLRMAKLVASKLALDELEKWVDAELKGYGLDDQSIPAYRSVRGHPMRLNPYHGWLPINFSGPGVRVAEKLSERKACQSIGELEDLVTRKGNREAGEFHMPYGPAISARISKDMGVPPTQTALSVERASLVGILDAVRNAVLDWALRLEKAGIRGEGVTFSDQEREKAHQPSIVYQINSITNFSGNLGPASGDAVVTSTQSIDAGIGQVRDLVAEIEKHLREVGLQGEQLERLKRQVIDLKAELAKSNPQPARIGEFLRSIRAMLEGAAGNIIASGILSHLDKLPAVF
jgi:hypothetical protein